LVGRGFFPRRERGGFSEKGEGDPRFVGQGKVVGEIKKRPRGWKDEKNWGGNR